MNKKLKVLKRKIRVRAKIKGTEEKPRLSVFRSNRFVYAQLINDEKGQTILGVSEKGIDGKTIGKKAIEKKVKQVVFDRGSYPYHGRVSAIAEGAREGGLKF